MTGVLCHNKRGSILLLQVVPSLGVMKNITVKGEAPRSTESSADVSEECTDVLGLSMGRAALTMRKGRQSS